MQNSGEMRREIAKLCQRHCERSEAIHLSASRAMDCFAALAMTWRDCGEPMHLRLVLKVLTYISGSRYSLPGNDEGGRYADRRCQGVGACHALGAQF
jgi:hypothetical protein